MKITIFGFAGSGTSTIGKLLAEKLNYKFMSSGNIMRELANKKNLSIEDFEKEFCESDFNFDFELDNKVKGFGEKNNNFIFESRMAWNFIPHSFKIYLKCSEQIRYKRICEREEKNFNEIKKITEFREKKFFNRMKKIYPKIIFPPNEKNFDFFINVEKILPDEIIQKILEKLK